MRRLADTVIEDPRWEAFGLPALAETAARAALGGLGHDPDRFELCVMGCDDARIAALNGDFRAKGQPTNVLSWPSVERGADAEGGLPVPLEPGTEDEPAELGDIAIAWETCQREAEDQAKTPAHHVTHLIVHAVLHLLGYDHVREGDAQLMERLEVAILADLGVADPYM
ncbi:MAG: rRNA maturation RNase YbeY [Paracoccaceae bacterium]